MRPGRADPATIAADLAPRISAIGAGFMSDRALNERGTRLGYQGIDFYLAGRVGVLGEVNAEVAAASLVFFNPTVVRSAWNRSASVQSRSDAAAEFEACAFEWAKANLPFDAAWASLARLANTLVGNAALANAPLFAGWSRRAVPGDPRLAVVHHLNSLREHRMACHAAALAVNGIAIPDAVRLRQPEMAKAFGWEPTAPNGPRDHEIRRRWDTAEQQTDEMVGRLYGSISPTDLDRFSASVDAAYRTIFNRLPGSHQTEWKRAGPP